MNKQKTKLKYFPLIKGDVRRTGGFTLVELIVVITILAILGTIAFISLQGYSAQSRDAVRISDLSSIKTGLELYNLDTGKYPSPNDETVITYSGAVAWTQGTFGEQAKKNIDKLDKVPTDPLTDKKYVYSTNSTRYEFQLAGAMEGDEVSYSPRPWGEGLGVRDASAASTKTAKLKITGNYNGKLLKVSTGSTDYVLALPSIMAMSGTTVESITANNYLAYNGYKNLPFQYDGAYKTDGETALSLVSTTNYVVFSGSLSTLSDTSSTGINARKVMLDKLQLAYSGTSITAIGEIAQILNTNTSDPTATEYVATNLVANNLGGSIVASTTSGSSTGSVVVSNSCATQPSYTNASFTAGSPTSANQVWQNTNSSNPCYYSCTNGYSGNDCSTAPSCALPPAYANALFVDGTPTSANQSRQNTNSANPCYYSCTNGYTGNDCSTAPAYTYCTAAGQIKYVIGGVVGTSSTGIACSDDIVVCSGNGTGYVLSACNIGSSTVGTGSTSYGHYIQRGNNSGTPSGTATTSTTLINGSSYGPSNNYSSTVFIKGMSSPYDWSSTKNDNLWGYSDFTTGGNTNKSLIKGPCNTGYHIPTKEEWAGMISAKSWGSNGNLVRDTLFMPYAGDRNYVDGANRYLGTYGHYWSITPYTSNSIIYHFNMGSTYLAYNDSNYGQRAFGYSVRCFKN